MSRDGYVLGNQELILYDWAAINYYFMCLYVDSIRSFFDRRFWEDSGGKSGEKVKGKEVEEERRKSLDLVGKIGGKGRIQKMSGGILIKSNLLIDPSAK